MNKLTVLKNVITSKVGRQLLHAQKHSPALLFGAGVVGVVTTVVLASRATLKIDEVLTSMENDKEIADNLAKENNPEYTEMDHQRDLVIIKTRGVMKIARMYAPAVGVGILSIAALTGSHVVLTRRNVALTAAYAALDRGFQDYRKRVVDAYGEDRDRELRYGTVSKEIVEETKQGPVTSVVKRHDPSGISVYARFFDELNANWNRHTEYNLLFLRCQQNYLNDMLHARGHVFLNEAYDALGMDRSQAGAVVGWVLGKGHDNYVDFGVFDGDNPRARDFVNGREGAILLDFNVDGVIFDRI